MRYLLRILFVLTLSLLSGHLYAAHHNTNHVTSERLDKLVQSDFQSVVNAPHSEAQQHYWGSDGFERHIKRDLFALVSYRRTSTDDGSLSLSFESEYHLLVAFLPPPLKELAWQTIPLPTDSYGMLKNQRSLYRLSGRKEANLLYVFKHGRESIITV
ncbi:hypothetical protein [Vibrio parahaemolyticus]|uniref:hypothetical protein n=1 Tax=Vibrio parahaemolyticus TaxID=670 RepID=UPI0003DC4EC2|nr:hypothetical protein [Vibrio parahaemolyticus]EHZ2589417.1 hypothetical protein [Vibrio parahaemolyticus]EJT0908570.1 hypothetical protein [Vibrio parahaemolyticus]ETJ85126.1 hypothetical protein D029_4748 [Vibrio parahaemolyticus 970107]